MNYREITDTDDKSNNIRRFMVVDDTNPEETEIIFVEDENPYFGGPNGDERIEWLKNQIPELKFWGDDVPIDDPSR